MAQFMDDVLRAFQMGQGIESNRMQMSAQRQKMQDEAIKREQQAVQANDYRVAEQEMAQGRPDVMQLGFPEQYREIQTKDLANQSTQMKMNEDRQQIRDKALEQGLTAASANPANWSKFVDYVERNKVYDPGELDRNMTQEQALKALGKFKAQRNAAAGKDPTMDLRKEFQGNQVYKDTQAIASAYKKIMSTSETGAGDMSLIFGYMKMLDPGSTVREGEYATAQNVGSVPQTVASMYNRALNGQKLAPEVRSQFKSEATSIFGAQKSRYGSLAKEYERLSTNLGVDPQNVVLDIGFDNTQSRSMMSPEQEKQLIQIVESGKSVDDALQEMGLTQ